MFNKIKIIHKSNKLLIILVIIFGVIFCGKVIFNKNKKINSTFTIREDTLTYDNLPDEFNGYKILQLSDLHSKEFGNDNRELISAIDKLKPDVIMATGDMFTVTDIMIDCDETKLVPFKLLSELAKRYKVVYVLGNHEEAKDEIYNGEYWGKRDRSKDNAFNRYLKKLQDAGVIFVNNDKFVLTIDDEGIQSSTNDLPHINVYGIYYSSFENKDKYVRGLRGNKDEFDILLCHDPNGFDVFRSRGFDLMLSGHVHGGVIRLPFVGGVLDPDRKLFPKYDKGIYGDDGFYMNVSVGLGDSAVPRFNNQPEINMIVLKKAKNT